MDEHFPVTNAIAQKKRSWAEGSDLARRFRKKYTQSEGGGFKVIFVFDLLFTGDLLETSAIPPQKKIKEEETHTMSLLTGNCSKQERDPLTEVRRRFLYNF